MAYDAVVSLLGELDNLLHIPLKILNIKKLQAKLFIEKVGEVLRILEMEGTPSLPGHLVKEIVHLALPIKSFIQGPGLRILQTDVEYVITTSYGRGGTFTTKVPEVIEQLSLIENKLQKFLDETDFYDVWEDFRSNLVVLPSRLAARNMLQNSQELKMVIKFFHELSTETVILCLRLRFLTRFLKLSTCLMDCGCSKDFLDGIKDVVNKVLDAVSCTKRNRLVSCSLEFDRVLLGNSRRSQEAKEKSIEKMAKEFFEGKNGMRLILLETLGKLHSFEGEIDMISEGLDKKLQLGHAPYSISQPLPYCVHVHAVPPPKGQKRRRMCSPSIGECSI